MYWSVYDVLMIVSGIITLTIVILPFASISGRTRVVAGAVGGGLVVLSLVLASLPYFRYPSVVVAGPIVALLSVLAVAGKAFRKPSGLQAGEHAQEVLLASPMNTGPGEPDLATHVAPTAQGIKPLPPEFGPEELMVLATQDRSRWAEIARHPSAYSGLLEWLEQYGDDAVRAAVGARRSAGRAVP